MTEHFNKSTQRNRRIFLRHHLTKAEAIMWKHLSRRQLLGFKFRRQYSVDNYIIDFYCPELKIAIEIDGDSHYRLVNIEYDQVRQKHIEHYGVKFIRFTNNEVYNNLPGVLDTIAEYVSIIKQDI